MNNHPAGDAGLSLYPSLSPESPTDLEQVMTPSEQPRILIIDDAPTNIEVLLGMLDEDYDLSFATSGRRALDLLANHKRPDLILLDVMMPDMDGYAVCAALKANAATRDIPVIFVTARTDVDSETRALAAGGVDFIHKPVSKAVLSARVQLHLELQRRTRELAQSLAEIARAQEQLLVLTQAIEQSPASIMVTDINGAIEYVNPAFTRETGYASAEVIGKNPRILQSGLTDADTFKAMWGCLIRGDSWSGELFNRNKSGAVYCEEAHIAPVKDTRGQVTHYVSVNLNITERKQTHERLAFLANHDVLTGLANRSLFFEQVEKAMALARRHKHYLALLFIDLDRFKPINDTWGHAIGDLVLQEIAKRMTDRLRTTDSVGRIGGDEFVVLLSDVGGAEGAMKVANSIRESLNQPFEVTRHRVTLSASIGIALYPDHGQDAIALARHADVAMYLAKQAGPDQVRLYQGKV